MKAAPLPRAALVGKPTTQRQDTERVSSTVMWAGESSLSQSPPLNFHTKFKQAPHHPHLTDAIAEAPGS